MKYIEFLGVVEENGIVSVRAYELGALIDFADTAAEKLGECGSFPKTIIGLAIAITKVIEGAEEC